MQLQTPELLAPAGTLEKAKFALDYGADAIYCGTNVFALRQHPGNFSYEDLAEAIKYAHARNKKVYLTMNIFAHNHHIKVIGKALQVIRDCKPDALIISDPGIFMLVHEQAPELPIHISTQASITNASGVKFWANQGAERIILARELPLREIKAIHDQFPDIQLETFVHGAQCMAYSGRCMLSSYMESSRKSNIGSCCNSCRWKYLEVEEAQRPGETITIEEDEHGTYIFNAHDMCMIQHLTALAEAGICSLKVEGRGRSIFYVTEVVKAYREALSYLGDTSDQTKQRLQALEDRLRLSSQRNFDTGFFFGAPQQNITNRKITPSHILVGILQRTIDDHTGQFQIKNEVYQGETIHVLTPDDEYTIKLDEVLLAPNRTAAPSAHGGKHDEIILTLPKPLQPRTLLWLDTQQRAIVTPSIDRF